MHRIGRAGSRRGNIPVKDMDRHGRSMSPSPPIDPTPFWRMIRCRRASLPAGIAPFKSLIVSSRAGLIRESVSRYLNPGKIHGLA
jgi:hypothetical protein